MEGDVAAVLVALDTSTNPSLTTHPTCELPSGRWYVPDAVDGLKEDRVGKTHFWDPKATYHVSPSAIVGLFEGTPSVGTKATFNTS